MLLAASAVSRSTLRRLALTALAAATLGLSACGGGDRSVEYKPTAMLVFGDEHSAITEFQVTGSAQTITGMTWAIDSVFETDARVCLPSAQCTSDADIAVGAQFFELTEPQWRFVATGDDDLPRSYWLIRDGKQSASAADTPTVQRRSLVTFGTLPPYGCTNNNWVQRVAASFGLGFRDQTGCANDGIGAVNHAEPGRTAEQVMADLVAYTDQMRKGVLVTVMVGQHDIMEQYRLVMAAPEGDRSAALSSSVSVLAQRGDRLARAIKSVTDTGAQVILVKTPNLSRSPFANQDGQDSSILNELSAAFNRALYINPEISRLGRSIAGVDTDEVTLINSSASGYTNDVAACDPKKLFDPETGLLVVDEDDMPRVCTNITLGVSDASGYVWATPRHLGPGAHNYIGSVAFNRASEQF